VDSRASLDVLKYSWCESVSVIIIIIIIIIVCQLLGGSLLVSLDLNKRSKRFTPLFAND
jgi:hypothetical protein